MKKNLYVNGEESGQIGKPVFNDSLGNQLYVGDIVFTMGKSIRDVNIVTKDCIYGWGSSTYKGKLDDVLAYKIINYTQIEKLNDRVLRKINANIEIKKLPLEKDMTISQIEKELGYSIKIIKD